MNRPTVQHHSVAAGERFPFSRRAPRYSIMARAEVTEPVSHQSVAGCVTAISLTGCYFRTVEALDASTVMKLSIEWHGAAFETWVRVVHATPDDGMGLAFLDLASAQLDVLNRWTEELAAGRS